MPTGKSAAGIRNRREEGKRNGYDDIWEEIIERDLEEDVAFNKQKLAKRVAGNGLQD